MSKRMTYISMYIHNFSLSLRTNIVISLEIQNNFLRKNVYYSLPTAILMFVNIVIVRYNVK